ncbi:MAG: hypothetical protein QOI17_1202, partial [Gaiellales bacterium]|nr:hypothetical protein [Gaiellales bacterium]
MASGVRRGGIRRGAGRAWRVDVNTTGEDGSELALVRRRPAGRAVTACARAFTGAVNSPLCRSDTRPPLAQIRAKPSQGTLFSGTSAIGWCRPEATIT